MVRAAKIASFSATAVQTDKGTISIVVLYAKSVWEYLEDLL
jgi:hypothetical protein